MKTCNHGVVRSQYICPHCSEYINLNWDGDIVKCKHCNMIILKKTRRQFTLGELLLSEHCFDCINEKIQHKIIDDETKIKNGELDRKNSFRERYKPIAHILKGHGIII